MRLFEVIVFVSALGLFLVDWRLGFGFGVLTLTLKLMREADGGAEAYHFCCPHCGHR